VRVRRGPGVTCLLALAGLLACSKAVPEHLRPPEPAAPASRPSPPQAPTATEPELVARMVGADPLGRATPDLDPDQVSDVPGGAPYAALLRHSAALDPSLEPDLAALRALEEEHRGTPLVALSRGARLRLAESLLAGGSATDPAVTGRVLALLTPLPADRSDEGLPLSPLHWTGADGPTREGLLATGDRWVLIGWLDGPDTPLEPVARTLGATPFDPVRATPAGRLVRAAARSAPEAPTELEAGLADLRAATLLALRTAASDGNRAQEALAAHRATLREELGTDDPLGLFLARARTRLTAAGPDARAIGGALVAIHAERWHGTCPDAPCVGLDRVAGFEAGARWDPEAGRLAALWALLALEEALDGVEVARDTVRHPRAMVDLVDALLGVGAVPPDPRILRQRRPDASTWLALGRAAEVEPTTTWEEARAALSALVTARRDAALRAEPADSPYRPWLEALRP
jgi:hypothetical protein